MAGSLFYTTHIITGGVASGKGKLEQTPEVAPFHSCFSSGVLTVTSAVDSASFTPLPIPAHPSWEFVHHCSSLMFFREGEHQLWEHPHFVFIPGITVCPCQAEGTILSFSWELPRVTSRLQEPPRLCLISHVELV